MKSFYWKDFFLKGSNLMLDFFNGIFLLMKQSIRIFYLLKNWKKITFELT